MEANTGVNDPRSFRPREGGNRKLLGREPVRATQTSPLRRPRDYVVRRPDRLISRRKAVPGAGPVVAWTRRRVDLSVPGATPQLK
eukprot:4951662-Alexandrium_andersonii.AAC.1